MSIGTDYVALKQRVAELERIVESEREESAEYESELRKRADVAEAALMQEHGARERLERRVQALTRDLHDAQAARDEHAGRVARESMAREQAERERDRYAEREKHFASVLGVADGGQYRADWDGAIRKLIVRAERAEADNAALLHRLRSVALNVRLMRDSGAIVAQGWGKTLTPVVEAVDWNHPGAALLERVRTLAGYEAAWANICDMLGEPKDANLPDTIHALLEELHALKRIAERWHADLLSVNPEFNDPEYNALKEKE